MDISQDCAAPKWLHNTFVAVVVSEKRLRQSLRLDESIWQAIDESCAKRPSNISRDTWIAEAIRDRLAQERANVENARDRNA